MREVGAFAAKTHLSELLAAAEAGETVLITRRGAPVARLVPAAGDAGDRAADRAGAVARIAALRDRLAAQGAGLTAAEILTARDDGRR